MKSKIIISGLVGATAGLAVATTFTNPEPTSIQEQLTFDRTAPERTGDLGGYADIVEEVSPAVVSVFASKSMVSAGNRWDPRIQRFYGQPPQEGLGSGVVLTADGYIVTNNHVISGADDVRVALTDDGDSYDAEVVGVDPMSDIAVLKIDATDLPTATLGDTSHIHVGDTVLAIGNPFGLGKTVTSGIVSALGRSLDIVGYEDFIQTDASINPGNSGGALVDNKGRLIGINTAIFSKTGSNVGIGFAIPVDMVVNITDQLISTGEVERGYIGVMLGQLSKPMAEQLNVDEEDGIVITQVMRDTPAAKAGLKPGDVITGINGEETKEVAKLRLKVSSMKPGEDVNFTVIRKGQEREVAATIGRLPTQETASFGRR